MRKWWNYVVGPAAIIVGLYFCFTGKVAEGVVLITLGLSLLGIAFKLDILIKTSRSGTRRTQSGK